MTREPKTHLTSWPKDTEIDPRIYSVEIQTLCGRTLKTSFRKNDWTTVQKRVSCLTCKRMMEKVKGTDMRGGGIPHPDEGPEQSRKELRRGSTVPTKSPSTIEEAEQRGELRGLAKAAIILASLAKQKKVSR